MLAQNFMTDEELGMTDEELAAHVAVLGMLERGELVYAPVPLPLPRDHPQSPKMFNMAEAGYRSECGTVGCIGGWVAMLLGVKPHPYVFAAFGRRMALYYPHREVQEYDGRLSRDHGRPGCAGPAQLPDDRRAALGGGIRVSTSQNPYPRVCRLMRYNGLEQDVQRWFFYDETGDEHGPYRTRRCAERELARYCRWLDSGPTRWQKIWWPVKRFARDYWRLMCGQPLLP